MSLYAIIREAVTTLFHYTETSIKAEAEGVEQQPTRSDGAGDGREGTEAEAFGGGEHVSETDKRRSQRRSGRAEETDRRLPGQGEEVEIGLWRGGRGEGERGRGRGRRGRERETRAAHYR